MKEKYMKKALEIAALGKRAVDLNPMVGALIIKDDTVISEGYHEVFGGPHAERNAINKASTDVEGATMVVTLEPCSHHGKTPPCADYIIEHKIKKVIIASLDPNPLVAGNGIKKLKEAGIEVEVGLCDEDNRNLNKVFYKYMNDSMPFITLKTAMTLDGKIASYTNDSKWITTESSRAYVHKMREDHKAIMVGINTVLKDDPMLNARNSDAKFQPIRIVTDSSLKIPLESNLVKTAKTYETIILTTNKADKMKKETLEGLGVKVHSVQSQGNKIDLKEAMIFLGSIGINSILLEGGGTLNEAMLKLGLVDEIVAFIAPKIIGGKDALTPVEGSGFKRMNQAIQLKLLEINQIDEDIVLHYKVLKEM